MPDHQWDTQLHTGIELIQKAYQEQTNHWKQEAHHWKRAAQSSLEQVDHLDVGSSAQGQGILVIQQDYTIGKRVDDAKE